VAAALSRGASGAGGGVGRSAAAGVADAAALDAVVAVGQAEMDGQGLMRLVGSW
jgi:hypothetical protein